MQAAIAQYRPVIIAKRSFGAGRVVTRANGVLIRNMTIPRSLPQLGLIPLPFVHKGLDSNGFRA